MAVVDRTAWRSGFLGVWLRDDKPDLVQTWIADPHDADVLWRHQDQRGSSQPSTPVSFRQVPTDVEPARALSRLYNGVQALFMFGDEAIWTLGGDQSAPRCHRVQQDTRVTSLASQAGEIHWRRSRVKQVICYRRDLKMRKGKIAAQCAHASMAVFVRRDAGHPSQLQVALSGVESWWTRGPFAKVVLSVADEDALLEVDELARARHLPSAVITDSGRTEFGGVPTRTTVAIGPAPVAWIDAITGVDGLVETKLA